MDSSGLLPKEAYRAMLNHTLSEPPPGVASDFKDPKFYGWPINIAAAVCLPFVLLFASIRIYSRLGTIQKWGLDDYIYVISLMSGISLISLILAVNNGGAYGHHAWDIRLGDLTKAILQRSYIENTLTGPLIWLTKLTLFFTISTVFNRILWLRICAYFGVGISFVFYISCAIIMGVVCSPVDGTDQLSYLAGISRSQCSGDYNVAQYVNIIQGAFNVVMDFYLLLISLPVVTRWTLPRRKKIGIYLIFLAGLAACTLSVLSLYYRLKLWNSKDITVGIIPLKTVSIVEIAIYLIIPCLTSVYKLYQHIHGYIISHSRKSSRSSKTEPIKPSASTYRELERNQIENEVDRPMAPIPWERWSFENENAPSRTSTRAATFGSQVTISVHVQGNATPPPTLRFFNEAQLNKNRRRSAGL